MWNRILCLFAPTSVFSLFILSLIQFFFHFLYYSEFLLISSIIQLTWDVFKYKKVGQLNIMFIRLCLFSSFIPLLLSFCLYSFPLLSNLFRVYSNINSWATEYYVYSFMFIQFILSSITQLLYSFPLLFNLPRVYSNTKSWAIECYVYLRPCRFGVSFHDVSDGK